MIREVLTRFHSLFFQCRRYKLSAEIREKAEKTFAYFTTVTSSATMKEVRFRPSSPPPVPASQVSFLGGNPVTFLSPLGGPSQGRSR